MQKELSQARIDELNARGASDLAVGCVIDHYNEEWTITGFSGHVEDDDGIEHEFLTVHISKDGVELPVEIETLTTGLHKGDIKPISPAWFIEEWQYANEPDTPDPEEVERQQTKRILADIKAKEAARPMEHWTDTEIFAKVSGAPLALAEDMLTIYEGNLARMANSTPKQMQDIPNIGKARAERIAAAFELGKRLARFHAEKSKITGPSDVADLMMSKMRYLQKEIVVVLALDTKGGVTSTGKTGEIADELKWGKKLAESQVFEGTLNASVFHPREIFRFAIEESANSIVLVHNHPSGDPQPSQEDIRATKQLIEAGNQIGIKVLDHIIIGDGIFVSLKEESFI